MTDIPEDVMKLARDVASNIILPEDQTRAWMHGVSSRIARALLADRAAQAERMARMEAALRDALRLLGRYRLETPAGHSPHMICAEVDEFAVRARALSQEGSDA